MRRPWRLTRRQRVEMEAALAGIRGRVDAVPRSVDRLRDAELVEDAAWGLLGDGDPLSLWPHTPGRVYPYEREVRVARARVAIALRAALRADEDARCEEAYAAAGCPAWGHADLGDVLTYDEGALAALDLLREWPGLARDLDTGRVPLALWEVA